MAGWNTYSLSDVIGDISAHTFVLPVVQRRLVWDADKMELLFDTLLKGDAFGGIMVIEEQEGDVPLFEYRPFSLHGEMIASSPNASKLAKRTFFVIDGQQRLQSFYIGLMGLFQGSYLFFDLFSDHSFFEFKFERDERALPGCASNGDEQEKRSILERKWYRVCTLYDRLKRSRNALTVANTLIAEDKSDDVRADRIRMNVDAFCRNVFVEKRVGVDSVSLNRNLDHVGNRQHVVELFRRLNDGGTRLSPYDLFASILKSYHYEMEGFLDETLAGYKSIGLNQDNLIKLVFLLQGDARKEMDSIEAADAKFAVTNQNRIKNVLEDTRVFLTAANLDAYFGSGNRTFIPIYFIAYHLFQMGKSPGYFANFDARNPDFKLMRDWFFHSLLNGVFRGRGAGWIPYKTGISQILGVVKSAHGKTFPLPALLDVYRKRLHFFTAEYRAEMLDRLDRDFLFYMIYDCKRTIRAQDVDHIHPRSKLEEGKVSPEKINSIANLQLIDSGTNRGLKNDSFFGEWLKRDVEDKGGFMRRHLIPTDPRLHEIENFDDFLTERGKLIAQKLQAEFQR